MKKFFAITAVVLIAATSCQKQETSMLPVYEYQQTEALEQYWDESSQLLFVYDPIQEIWCKFKLFSCSIWFAGWHVGWEGSCPDGIGLCVEVGLATGGIPQGSYVGVQLNDDGTTTIMIVCKPKELGTYLQAGNFNVTQNIYVDATTFKNPDGSYIELPNLVIPAGQYKASYGKGTVTVVMTF